jgi:hypothetical protein
MTRRRTLSSLAIVALAASCRFDSAYRDAPDPAAVPCDDGSVACAGDSLVRCESGVRVTLDDCAARGARCAPSLLACTPCLPGEASCDGLDVVRCDADGQKRTRVETCDADHGIACRGGVCTDLCAQAASQHSNVGCEYWAVDLDNAVVPQGNAAAQQYAVIVSNAQPDLVAHVVVDEDDAKPGEPAALRTVGTARVGPHALEVFKLGPREVDCSPIAPDGTVLFNQGSNTCLSRQAYRIRSDVPIVAYQFNPLENVNVFSNDASLLFPTAALGGGGGGHTYIVASWPQTIAQTSDPDTNFGLNLRAYLAIVGTQADTRVHVKTTARIVPGGPLDGGVDKGGELDVTLQPFEVLNLETGDFNADFTGSFVDATGPVAVFSGGEASDAPFYATLASRACCADHLETQLVPVRAVGKRYVASLVPNRSKAIAAAGGAISPFDEPEFFRVVAAAPGTTKVTTTLAPPDDAFELDGEGASRTITAHRDFLLDASQPVLVADMQASQEAAGVVRGLPGGDPSLRLLPSIEQWRSDYVLLTPDKYVFDFLVITAPFGAEVFVDGLPVDGRVCETGPADGLTDSERKQNPPFVSYRCQLSFPVVLPDATPPNNVLPGRQDDGVHRVQSDYPIAVLVYGFDSYVSYAYTGGTELKDLNPR